MDPSVDPIHAPSGNAIDLIARLIVEHAEEAVTTPPLDGR
jgi:hypothetical protein